MVNTNNGRNNARSRARQEENNENSERNVRRNVGTDISTSTNLIPEVSDRQEPFCPNVDLGMGNLQPVQSHTAGAMYRGRPFNPNSELISLNSLLSKGSRHGTNIVAIILSITSAAGNHQMQVQQRYNGARGQVNSIRHDRRMVIMCPLSPPGSNTAIILFGSGTCERFFEHDISLRDNGAIRKSF